MGVDGERSDCLASKCPWSAVWGRAAKLSSVVT